LTKKKTKKAKAMDEEKPEFTQEQQDFLNTDNNQLVERAIWVCITNILKEVEVEYITMLTKK